VILGRGRVWQGLCWTLDRIRDTAEKLDRMGVASTGRIGGMGWKGFLGVR
jgi:hypothetical protein